MVGVVTRAIILAEKFELKNWAVGVNALLTTISSDLLYLTQLAKSRLTTIGPLTAEQTRDLRDKFIPATALLALTIFLLMILVLLHAKFENSKSKLAQACFLCVFGNLAGLGLLFAFIIFVKGVD